jgi:shikimate 5-dehydrogenase
VNVSELAAATKRSFYFVGVTTSSSSIMRVFPRWAQHLKLGDVAIRGIDCKWHDEPDVYRKVVAFLKTDPLSLGGLVTTHKMDLLEAARSEFDYLDPYAALLAEISCISKAEGKLLGHAKDAISSGLALDAFVPTGHFRRTGAELCLLGAGGSSLALTCHIMKERPKEQWPSRIVITNRSPKRLEHMRDVHLTINPGVRTEYVLAQTAGANDQVVNALKPGSLVINATGLGKDAPGSPLTAAARFPKDGLVWEYNYRGELVFLDQARAQQKAQNLTIEDGWVYFIHGWTRVIAEVFHREIPSSGPVFEDLCRIAAQAR